MGALEHEGGEKRETSETDDLAVDFGGKDVEKGEMGDEDKAFETNPPSNFHASILRTLNPTNPLRVVINSGTRVPLTTPPTPLAHGHRSPLHPSFQPRFIPTTTPTPQIAAYGKNFTKSSIDTWAAFERQGMEKIVDSDIISAVCFLSGVCSGSICVLMVAAWTHYVHQGYTATLSLLAFYVGYLMTRIAMALPHACVSCYFVCYAENPESRLFDKDMITNQLELTKSGRDYTTSTPRVPHRFNRTRG